MVLQDGRSLMTPQGERILLFAGNPVHLRKELGGHAHMQRPLRRDRVETRVDVESMIHGKVMHVLESPGDLDVLSSSRDGVDRLVQRLQAAPAKPVHGRAGRRRRKSSHQRDDARNVHALLTRLLRVPEDHVLHKIRVDPGSLEESLYAGDGQIVAADISKNAALGVRAADRRSHAIDNDCLVHDTIPRE